MIDVFLIEADREKHSSITMRYFEIPHPYHTTHLFPSSFLPFVLCFKVFAINDCKIALKYWGCSGAPHCYSINPHWWHGIWDDLRISWLARSPPPGLCSVPAFCALGRSYFFCWDKSSHELQSHTHCRYADYWICTQQNSSRYEQVAFCDIFRYGGGNNEAITSALGWRGISRFAQKSRKCLGGLVWWEFAWREGRL
jgi:hypothetical protein